MLWLRACACAYVLCIRHCLLLCAVRTADVTRPESMRARYNYAPVSGSMVARLLSQRRVTNTIHNIGVRKSCNSWTKQRLYFRHVTLMMFIYIRFKVMYAASSNRPVQRSIMKSHFANASPAPLLTEGCDCKLDSNKELLLLQLASRIYIYIMDQVAWLDTWMT